MTARTTPVEDLFKLVDACNQCYLAFRSVGEQLNDLRFREFSDRLRATLERFIFELKKEILRIGGRQPAASITSRIGRVAPASMIAQAEAALQSTLEDYDGCLSRPMPAHARAMIQRQRQGLHQFMSDLIEMASEVFLQEVPTEPVRRREYCSRHPRR